MIYQECDKKIVGCLAVDIRLSDFIPIYFSISPINNFIMLKYLIELY